MNIQSEKKPMTMIDVQSEQSRTYHYPNDATFTVAEPLRVHVLLDERGVSHRIEASDGQAYRPERGWLAISWLPKEGAPPFVA